MKELLAKKRIVILGLGREGISSFRFLTRKFPESEIILADRQEPGHFDREVQQIIASARETFFGKDYLRVLRTTDVVFRSPGVPFFLPELLEAKKRGITILSQTKLFFKFFPGTIIGITGTKGKSTTTKLTYDILRKVFPEVILIGNIGKPALEVFDSAKKTTIAVYELSSHQLGDLTQSPHIAVLLEMVPEHLDYYQNEQQYYDAKGSICRYQKAEDYIVFNPVHRRTLRLARQSAGTNVQYSLESPHCPGAFLKQGWLHRCFPERERVISKSDIPLKGIFNLENVLASIAATSVLGVSPENQREAIRAFRPLPHRLEFVGRYRGITFYNDSLATTPQATIAALGALGSKVSTVMLGGWERHLSYSTLVSQLGERGVRFVVCFPESGKRIARLIKKRDLSIKTVVTDSMREAVQLVYQNTFSGKICLLSPAAPSFGIFKSYEDRGNQFKYYAKTLA
ncbi:UDP-N-acetylmuramoylalanine--D-glutamate ligase [Microgenomates group bacterium RIFCSPLOWO2_01_FULL_46_13]|nr:MAG: UDP-N-acetylmuramoylalanine--D-glutamate ligase [Microgenomates group bacterium RIFCSPHIGHO2_01_FULL_45_11]OGV94624.1 MAG: UDP-N-acetylmuramoylalanine--D-glutamate ligase [Microgenomates group bacterium RIFCSPLOWO2_01_FULL_46_13]